MIKSFGSDSEMMRVRIENFYSIGREFEKRRESNERIFKLLTKSKNDRSVIKYFVFSSDQLKTVISN